MHALEDRMTLEFEIMSRMNADVLRGARILSQSRQC